MRPARRFGRRCARGAAVPSVRRPGAGAFHQSGHRRQGLPEARRRRDLLRPARRRDVRLGLSARPWRAPVRRRALRRRGALREPRRDAGSHADRVLRASLDRLEGPRREERRKIVSAVQSLSAAGVEGSDACRYGKTAALSGVTFTVARGSVSRPAGQKRSGQVLPTAVPARPAETARRAGDALRARRLENRAALMARTGVVPEERTFLRR